MYLVTAYFDEKTNKRIQKYINLAASKSGNTFMLDANVPPHLTLSAFETRRVSEIIPALEKTAAHLDSGSLTWCSVGAFLPYVLHIAPVLNGYLQNLSTKIYETLVTLDDVKISPLYRPTQWFPHTTLGKKLTKEEMLAAFSTLQEHFAAFDGQITHIGLSKPNPHVDLVRLKLPYI
ncbi:2'-5' RNA ligase family protein [Roseburia hominis]